MIMNNNSNIMKYGVSAVCNKEVRKQLLEQKDECINALMWPKIKSCAIPDQIRKTQESSWENQNEGIVLKKYKMRFNRLNVLEDIEEYESKIIRKMRVGNSKLNKHSKKNNRLCWWCNDQEETNEHYILDCPKFQNERNMLKKNTKELFFKIGKEFKVKYLMGCYEPTDYYIVKRKRIEIMCILKEMCKYIRSTKRFVTEPNDIKSDDGRSDENSITDDEKIAEERI